MFNMSFVRPPTLSVTQISTFRLHNEAYINACVVGNRTPNSIVSAHFGVKENTVKMPSDLKPPLRTIIICSSQAIFTSTTESWYFTSGMLFTQSEAGILVMINAIRQDLQSRISVSEQQESNAWQKVLSANWKLSSPLLPVYRSLSSVLLCLLS